AVTKAQQAAYVDDLGTSAKDEVEPWSNYFAARARRDLNQGRTAFGVIGTAVHRSLEPGTALAGHLHSDAYAAGVDFRHDLPGRTWTFSGQVTPSLVLGSPDALVRTQRRSARYFQRPDARHLAVDSSATSLAGYAAKIDVAKESGAWRGSTTFTAGSPSFEVNDLGFQRNADRFDLNTQLGYDSARPGSLFRRWNIGIDPSATWNYGGDLLSAPVGLSGSAQLLGYPGLSGSLTRNFTSWDDRFTRGGPLTRSPGSYSGNASFN